jgi:hypothetical protein
MQKTILSPRLDYALLFFPIWVGIAYLLGVIQFPQFSELIFIVFLVLLGETHFACTWLFFVDKNNWNYLKQKQVVFFYFPAILLALFFAICLFDLTLGVLVSGAASGFHVTRQSIGVMRLAGHTKHGFAELAVYAMSGAGLIAGFIRFKAENLFGLSIDWIPLAILLVLINLCFALYFSRSNKKMLASFLTGSCLYLCYMIVPSPQDAIAIGVGMHWCQYLALNYKIHFKVGQFATNGLSAIVLIFLYAGTMAFFGTDGFTTTFLEVNSYLLLIPLTSQMLHYYFDAFIWKLSDPHIRATVGKSLYG